MAIVVRAIAREDVPKAGVLAGLAKEAITGAIDGLAVGLVTGVVVAAVYGNLYLSLVVLAAMVGNMVIAGTSGLLVPVVLKACHQDPAVSSSIFVTTATDVLGFLLFLGLAQLFLPLIV
jgi:magnesium transporter